MNEQIFAATADPNDSDYQHCSTNYIAQFERHFVSLLEQLKQDSLKTKSDPFINKPWFLVAGSEQTGKKSLFANSNLPEKKSFIDHDIDMQIWQCTNAVYITLPSQVYNFTDINNLTSCLRHNIKKYRGKHYIDGILFIMNPFALAENAEAESIAIQRVIDTLHLIFKKQLSKLPLFLGFSHFDWVTGFDCYFAANSNIENMLSKGFRIPSHKNYAGLIQYFHQQFDNFLSTLQADVIQRMHMMRSPEKQQQIREFPLQLETLRSLFSQLLYQLNHQQSTNFNLAGIYFFSANLGGTQHDRLHKLFQRSYSISLPQPSNTALQTKACFTDRLLATDLPQHPLIQRTRYQLQNRNKKRYIITAAAAAICFTITGSFLFINYKNTLRTIQHTQALLTNYQIRQAQLGSKQHKHAATTEILQLLDKTQHSLTSSKNNWLAAITHPSLLKLQYKTQNIYNHLLMQNYLPWLNNKLVSIMTDKKQNNITEIYLALETYLMLNQTQHFKAHKIINNLNWLQTNSEYNFGNENLIVGLAKLLQATPAIMSLDENAIVAARHKINLYPPSYIAYGLIQSDMPKTLSQNINQLSNIFELAQNKIPAIYSWKGFQLVLETKIPAISNTLQHQQWVLGDSTLLNHTNSAALQHAVLELYFKDYTNWWHWFISHTSPLLFTNSQQAITIAEKFADHSKQITYFTNILDADLDFKLQPTKTAAIFNEKIASQFYSASIKQSSGEAAQNLPKIMQQLVVYFSLINHSAENNKYAWEISKDRFIGDRSDAISALFKLSSDSAQPWQLWIKKLALNTWLVTLQHAKSYINQQWRSDIYKFYQQQIAWHYPLDPASKQEVDRKTFSVFFSPDGMYQNFVQRYLSPFIDTTNGWKMKKVDGLRLAMDKATVAQLIRASLINKMFYPNNQPQMKIEFTLQPISFEPIVSSLLLDIDGHELYDYQGSSKISHFSWPGANDQQRIHLRFETVDKQRYEMTETGPWDLFHLLDKLNLRAKRDTQHYQIVFDLNGSAARYKLVTKNKINPFIPGILKKLQLPSELS